MREAFARMRKPVTFGAAVVLALLIAAPAQAAFHNVTIVNNGGVNAGGSFSGGTPDVFTPTADNAVVDVGILTGILATKNAQINVGSSGTQAGNIQISNAVNWAGGTTTRTLKAANTITQLASITGPSLSL